MSLLLPANMPQLPGVEVPQTFYWVMERPAPLAGMTYPSWTTAWNQMYHAGFRHVICLTAATFPYDPAPLNKLHAVELTDLYDGGEPPDPAREVRRIRLAALAALGSLAHGEGVVIHCAGGTGRTGAVIGCLLRMLGYAAPTVLNYLDELHKARGRAGWPESRWQATVIEG